MDIIKTYAPGNTNITAEEIAAMKDLTDEQIATLAKAYPNQPTGNAYLVYYITGEKPHDQRFPLGTWANLHALRNLGRKDILPYHFHKMFFANKSAVKTESSTKQRVVDLSESDLKDVEGLKVNATNVDHVVTIEPGDTVSVVESAELIEAKAELQQAIDDKAHHMTVKALQKRVDELTVENILK